MGCFINDVYYIWNFCDVCNFFNVSRGSRWTFRGSLSLNVRRNVRITPIKYFSTSNLLRHERRYTKKSKFYKQRPFSLEKLLKNTQEGMNESNGANNVRVQCWWMILKGLNCDEFNLSSSNCCKNIHFIFHPLSAIFFPLVCHNLYYFLPSSQSKYEFDEIITNTQSIIILVGNGIL